MQVDIILTKEEAYLTTKAVQGQCRHVGKDFIGDTNIYPPRVAGNLVNAHQTQGIDILELVNQLNNPVYKIMVWVVELVADNFLLVKKD